MCVDDFNYIRKQATQCKLHQLAIGINDQQSQEELKKQFKSNIWAWGINKNEELAMPKINETKNNVTTKSK